MFGNNPIHKPELAETDGHTLAVQEVFETLQGEGPLQGVPCVFVRLAGCNLACTFCDTEFESGINNRMAVKDLVAQIRKYKNGQTVILTGGEPMRQRLRPFIEAFFSEGDGDLLRVQIETAGTLWQPDLEPWILRNQLMLVVSPKTPKIAAGIKMFAEHYKYVIRSTELGADGLPIYSTQTPGQQAVLARPPSACITSRWEKSKPVVWVSPCDDYDPVKNDANRRAAIASCFAHGYRLSMQQHKTLGLP